VDVKQDTSVVGSLGPATVGTKGQIVIPADAREAMQIKEGDKVVILRGPREGSVLVFRVDSFDVLLQKAGIADDEPDAGDRAGRTESDQ
jgi:AbrB family looped-hinge helix DNA binding protein